MPSTAVDLGEVEVDRNLTEQEQIAEVKSKGQEWMQRQPTMEGEQISLQATRPIGWTHLNNTV